MELAFDTNWMGPPELRPRCYRSQIEKDIWMSICAQDEYHCPQFEPSDTVFDIGGNIGAFAYRAWLNGSRNIHSFEINHYHCEGWRQNLEGCDGVKLYHAAVVRGDRQRKPVYHLDEGGWSNLRGNTAGACVPWAVSLDELIKTWGTVRYIKIDCEGSEWPILYTATLLGKVQEIMGEYHDDVSGPELAGLPASDPAVLCKHLQTFGFQTEFEPMSEKRTGHFHAWR